MSSAYRAGTVDREDIEWHVLQEHARQYSSCDNLSDLTERMPSMNRILSWNHAAIINRLWSLWWWVRIPIGWENMWANTIWPIPLTNHVDLNILTNERHRLDFPSVRAGSGIISL